jgi:hypothetical protein
VSGVGGLRFSKKRVAVLLCYNLENKKIGKPLFNEETLQQPPFADRKSVSELAMKSLCP